MMRPERGNFERWLWIDLIAFDNQKSDFGVKEYLDNTGFVPEGLSLLINSPDFVHTHEGMKEDEDFPADCCSYAGRPGDEERERQVWTKYQLQKLIEELHNYQIKVYFAVFDTFLNNKFHEEWVDKNREVLATTRDGRKMDSINPLARLKDNTYYEDFFIRKLAEVTRDYGFDGYHIADGYNHLRYPLSEVDYADDMVSQFIENTGVRLPGDISGKYHDNKILLKKRADWIWRNKRLDWINFFVRRWEGFFRKVVTALHGQGKQVMFNTSWTRDPFEAIYRYGIDYRRVAQAGVDKFIIECVGASNEIGVEAGVVGPGYIYKIMATILLTKASIPEAKIISLQALQDKQENWEVLRHAPTLLEKEIYSYPNLFCLDSHGKFRRCLEGLLACLAGSVTHQEWKWLQFNWERSFSLRPRSIAGATLVWSDKALDNQLADVINTRNPTTHNILYRLLSKGAPVYSVVNINNIDMAPGPLLVINHHHFPEIELRKILAYKNGAVIMIGKRKELFPEADFQFEDVYTPDQLFMGVYGLKELRGKLPPAIVSEGEEEIPPDLAAVKEPIYYHTDLYSRKISPDFLNECVKVITQSVDGFVSAKVITQSVDGFRILSSESVKVLTMKRDKDERVLLVRNDAYGYVNLEIDVGRNIDSVKIITRFPYKPIVPQGSKFIVRVPPKGIVVLEVSLAKPIGKKEEL